MYEVLKRVFKSVQTNEKVDLAIPYVYSFRKGGQLASHFNMEQMETLAKIQRESNQDPTVQLRKKPLYFSGETENTTPETINVVKA